MWDLAIVNVSVVIDRLYLFGNVGNYYTNAVRAMVFVYLFCYRLTVTEITSRIKLV